MSEWIKASDYLPVGIRECIVTWTTKKEDFGLKVGVAKWYGDNWCWPRESEFINCIEQREINGKMEWVTVPYLKEVIAWQFFPEPYKESEGADESNIDL